MGGGEIIYRRRREREGGRHGLLLHVALLEDD